MKPCRHLLAIALAACSLSTAVATAAETQLYDTGPSEDASFLRFVNATAAPVSVVPENRQTRMVLDAAKPATDFLPVKANSAIAGAIEQGSARAAISVRVAPGAFATVVVLPDGKDGMKTVTVSETPDDFNGLKASLAFYSLDPSCAHADLKAAGRDVSIVDDVAQGTLKRRAINPVQLSVLAACAGQSSGAPLDLGQLQAGKRYSILAVPGPSGTRLIRAEDTLAR
jgi:hypothetical protein